LTLVNGINSTQISVDDRGLLYGQSVFETIAVLNGQACLLDLHIKRLRLGCEVLGIPVDVDLLIKEIEHLISNSHKLVLRVTITMAAGGRGYLNPENPESTRVLSLHEYPTHPTTHWEEGVKLGTAAIRLAHQPALAGIKHGNRLEQVIARSEWRDTWHEALLLDQLGNVIEATQSNVFAIKDNQLLTPSLEAAGVAGVMREFVITNAYKLGLSVKTMSLSVDDIEAADEVFLTNSVIGLWPVNRFNTRLYNSQETSSKLLKLMIKNEVIPHYKT